MSGRGCEPPEIIRHHTEIPLNRCPLNNIGLSVQRKEFKQDSVTLSNLIESFIHVKNIETFCTMRNYAIPFSIYEIKLFGKVNNVFLESDI